jgi:hypothetical protein
VFASYAASNKALGTANRVASYGPTSQCIRALCYLQAFEYLSGFGVLEVCCSDAECSSGVHEREKEG